MLVKMKSVIGYRYRKAAGLGMPRVMLGYNCREYISMEMQRTLVVVLDKTCHLQIISLPVLA